MPTIDPFVAQKLQRELLSGETIYWAGMPNPRIIFHSDDWIAIPFSLLWGGFAIFWEAGVLGFWDSTTKAPQSVSSFMALWGVPFILIGQYMIWGRFLYDAWLKRNTYYAVTNRRILILQEAWKRKSNFVFLDTMSEVSREGDAHGTLWLGPKLPMFGSRGSRTRSMTRFSMGEGTPVLADIDDVDSVYRLILDLRDKSGAKTSALSYGLK